jgi:hypothetical protein
MRIRTPLIVLGVLMLVDGLLLLTSTSKTAAKVVQTPLYVLFWMILYQDNRERFHRPVSRKVFFGSIFGALATLTVFVLLGLTLH